MKHQAHKLEVLMDSKRKKRFEKFKQSLSRRQNIITVSSGKGGVGKSTFVTNLSIVMSRLNKKVLVLDADLGLANLHILFKKKKTKDLSHVFKSEASLEEIITATDYNVDLICGGSGVSQLIDLSEEEIWLFLEQIKEFNQYDYIIIDVGAGVSRNVLTFLKIASQVIIITTPEPTALTDAYGLLKAFSSFNQGALAVDNFFTIVNKSYSMEQSRISSERLHQTCKRYLNIDLKGLGYLPNDEYLVNSVYEQKPLVTTRPLCQFSKRMIDISRELITETDQLKAEASSPFRSFGFDNLIKKLIH